jgi:hypothetical protein
MRRILFVAAFAVGVAASASPAGASTTIGQLAPNGFTSYGCAAPEDLVQPTVTSGTAYAVPSGGATITSWSTHADSTAGVMFTFKVFRPAGGSNFTVVAHDGPHAIAPNMTDTFPVNIAVQPGDLIGYHNLTSSSPCAFAGGSDPMLYLGGDIQDGTTGGPFNSSSGWRLNLTAEVSGPIVSPTGQRAAALASCKKRARKHHWAHKRLKKCKKRAKLLPV